ncbi:MAG: MgtC/SapB family protein [Candidatus Omnitrophota bacterium]
MTGEILDTLIKIVLSVVLSGFIGAEREIRHKGAGLRTHILVGVGSTLIVLTSFHVSDMYKDIIFVDPSRMIAGVVTGIGFLCAGTIFRSEAQITGLTTSASVWIVSGIGIAVGCGDFSAAIVVTAVVFLVLIGLRSLEKKLQNFNYLI